MYDYKRCYSCGSKNIVSENKKEGFSLGKAAIGTVAVGPVGLIAGATGKKNTYYHCLDCGLVLNKCMSSEYSYRISKAIANNDWEEIKTLKEIYNYKNIEYTEKDYIKSKKELDEYDREIIDDYVIQKGKVTKKQLTSFLEEKGYGYFTISSIGNLYSYYEPDENGVIMGYDNAHNIIFKVWSEEKKEDTNSKTKDLNDVKKQALSELGYSSINESNAKEVFEKIAEIMYGK